MNSSSKFLVAFNRDRDSYQVAVAFSEVGRLQALVTDLYVPDKGFFRSICERVGVGHRSASGLASREVTGSTYAVAAQLASICFVKSEKTKLQVFKAIDKHLSRKALRVARGNGCDLLLYSGYAFECFRDPAMADRRKGLFVFHPYGEFTRGILERDRQDYPVMQWSHDIHARELDLSDSDRVKNEVVMADFIVCASEFTARSIRPIAENAKQISVVPYGCDPIAMQPSSVEERTGDVRMLFVGQGVSRKGIHLLLIALARSSDRNVVLTMVCSRMDPAVEKLVVEAGISVKLKSNLSQAQLTKEYLDADIFVMPSLVEGFGLVYLEALSAGCFVIGTNNSGLPDLDPPQEVGSVVRAGDVEQLIDALQHAASMVRQRKLDRRGIVEFASTRSWSDFRQGVRHAARYEASIA